MYPALQRLLVLKQCVVARSPVIAELHRTQTAELALVCMALSRRRRFERLGSVQTNSHFIGMQHSRGRWYAQQLLDARRRR